VNTLQEFVDYLAGLSRHDLSVSVALAELLRAADDLGSTDRGTWVTAVREAYGQLSERSAVSGREQPGERGMGRYLEELVSRLETRRMVLREPPGEGWERLGFRADLWDALRSARPQAQEAADTVVSRLSRRDEAGGVSAGLTPGEGSRLHASDLTKVYRKRKVVNDVAIEVEQGEIVGLLGPNGAGKTTTFYMIVGLIPPNKGRVYLDEREITNVPMFKRARMGVGYLAQEPSVFRKLTVEENVLAILETLKLSRQDRRERLEELLAELSLTHLRDNKAYSLSGGERRRLEITRALVQRPKFMLLDEPFAGIDPIAVNDIQQIVGELKHRGIGVIITDHNVEQTLEIVDRAYIMYEGRIRVSGTVSELVWNDEVADIYLGPTLTQRMRQRYERPVAKVV
jgi:lipopolysaccharide export system ATP-binding protein